MKVMGLERDNTTLPGSTDPCGWHYSASFELYPFHEGKDRAVYKGILNGKGPKRGRFCVVKAKLDTTAAREDWKHVQDIVRKAHALAKTFNSLLGMRAISFEWPVIAELDTVSDFTCLVKFFKPHDKKIRKGEMVVIEDFLEGKFETFSSTVGWVNPDSKTDVTQAFSHYTWHSTHELVVCGLQGVSQGNGFQLTTPTIHSKCRQYGMNDGGLAGIVEFFSTHRCNNICSSWPGLDVPEIKSQPDVKVHHSPTKNQPRRNRNVFPCPEQLHTDYVPRAPSAPVFETTRF